MVTRRRSRRLFSLALVVAVLGALLATAAPAPASTLAAVAAPAEQSAILFAADGMRPDLVDRYAASGAMPNMRELKRRGVQGRNGLTQGFPPNTGVGWYTLATGAWPGKHGSTNNTFHQTGTDFSRGPASPPPASSRPTRSPRPPSGPGARSPSWTGSPAGRPTSPGRPSTSPPSSRPGGS